MRSVGGETLFSNNHSSDTETRILWSGIVLMKDCIYPIQKDTNLDPYNMYDSLYDLFTYVSNADYQ